MNLAALSQKLFAAARANPPSEHVPYAFEQRIMAQLRGRAVLDQWAQWAGALWRGAVPCVALSVILGAWSWFSPGVAPAAGDLSQAIENTVLAAADQDSPADALE